MSSVKRIVCEMEGEMHNSATPDLAMNKCPVCGAGTTPIDIDATPAEELTLLDLLYSADAIEIDGVFCRWFHIEYEDIENDEDTVLEMDFETDGETYEYYFSKEQLRNATKYPESSGWRIQYGFHTVSIVPYKLSEIKA